MRTRLGADEGVREIVSAFAIALGKLERVDGSLQEFLPGVEATSVELAAHVYGGEFV